MSTLRYSLVGSGSGSSTLEYSSRSDRKIDEMRQKANSNRISMQISRDKKEYKKANLFCLHWCIKE